MSEQTDMMTKQEFLEVCMGIEQLCADVYHFYSKIYKEIPEASRLWKKAALEEENHQRQFKLALRLLPETEFVVPPDSLKQANSIQCKLLKFMDHIKSNKPDLLAAVSKAVEMEERLADLHARTALKFRDESLQKLFKVLSEADRDHVVDLQSSRTILFLPHCEMGG